MAYIHELQRIMEGKPKSITIQFDGDEYRVPAPDGREAGASYTNDKQDALGTAKEKWKDAGNVTFKIKKVEEIKVPADPKTSSSSKKVVVIQFNGSEYRVPAPNGKEAGAYYTNDEKDALGTAKAMWKDKSNFEVQEVEDFEV